MSEEKMRDVVAAHIEDLRKTAIVIDSFPDFATTSAEIRKAADELEAALQESEAGAVAEVVDNKPYWIPDAMPVFLPNGTKLYAAPPSAQAIETAAIMKCVEVCDIPIQGDEPAGFAWTRRHIKAQLLALIPQDGRTALLDMCMEAVAKGDEYGRRMESENEFSNPSDLRAIVTNLIGVPPLSSGGGK